MDSWDEVRQFQASRPAFKYGVFEDAIGWKAWQFEQFFARIHSTPWKSALEFGCGTAWYRDWFREGDGWKIDSSKKLKYTGADGDSGMIEESKKRWPDDTFVLCPPEQALPFSEDSFDLIVTIAVLQHSTNSQKEFLLKEFHRILQSKGRLLIWEETFGNHYSGQDSEYGRTFSGWNRLVESCGFIPVWAHEHQHEFVRAT